MNDEQDDFLSRWSRRKVRARQGETLPAPLPTAPVETAANPPVAVAPAGSFVPGDTLPALSVDRAPASATAQPEPAKPAPPTMSDVATLTRESDFSRFMSPGVDGEVKNAALRKLFADPHFNVMDGLDTYIDDYSKPDPLPLELVRKMTQAAFLGLVEAEPPAASGVDQPQTATAQAPKSAEVEAADAGVATPEPDENADLRLQPHDAARCDGAEDSAAADERRQS